MEIVVIGLIIALILLLSLMAVLLKREITELQDQVKVLRLAVSARQGTLRKATTSGPVFRREPTRTTQRSVETSRTGRMSKLIPLQGGNHGHAHDRELPQDS